MKNYFYVLILISITSCNQNIEVVTSKVYNDCFILKPVLECSPLEEPEDFNPVAADQYFSTIDKVETSKIVMDTMIEYVMGYNMQKRISIDYSCFDKLSEPDSSFIVEIFLNSMPNTNSLIDSVTFLRRYEKDIFNFGNASIFEYSLEGTVEAAPRNLVMIIRDVENRYKKNYTGIVFSCDGVKWVQLRSGKNLPALVETIKRGKSFEILTSYDGDRFVPLVHKKIGEW